MLKDTQIALGNFQVQAIGCQSTHISLTQMEFWTKYLSNVGREKVCLYNVNNNCQVHQLIKIQLSSEFTLVLVVISRRLS